MADVPYPLTEDNFEGLRRQLYELIRRIYEEKIGGADLGDTFAIVGDVLTLVLATTSGLTKSGNELSIETVSTGGLSLSSSGIQTKLISTGGLESSASGLGVKLAGVSLTSGASGLSVTLPIDRSGIATLVAGTVTVNDTNITANSRIFLTPQDNDTAGFVKISARVVGTSFTITSSNGGDTGVIAYLIIEP